MAVAHSGQGITLRKISEEEIAFVAFHDAAWGNVPISTPQNLTMSSGTEAAIGIPTRKFGPHR